MDDIQLIHGNCLVKMQNIPDKSCDLILCDLPYGQLNKGNKHAAWDVVIPFEPLWEQYKRIIKDNGAIILFAQGMFTAQLMMSNPKIWRYNIVWNKSRVTGFLNAKRMPLRIHEDICVFYKKLPTYNPQMRKCRPHERNHGRGKMKDGSIVNNCYGKFVAIPTYISDEKFPTSIINISKEHMNNGYFHPTQKPVRLLEYLIKTYTNEGDTVIDNCMGSGSCGVAAVNTNRKFIGIELDENYYNIAKQRIEEAIRKKNEKTLFD